MDNVPPPGLKDIEALRAYIDAGLPLSVRVDPPQGVYSAHRETDVRSITFVVNADSYDQIRVSKEGRWSGRPS